MSFVAKKKKKKRNDQNQETQTPHTVLQKLSPKTTRVPLSETELRGRTVSRKNRHFLKNCHPIRRPMSFAAKGKKINDQNQDKRTPQTVLPKLSPKNNTSPLKVQLAGLFFSYKLIEYG